MNSVQENETLAVEMPGVLAPDIADAFLRRIWNDAVHQRVSFSKIEQPKTLRKHSLDIHGRDYPPLVTLHWGLTAFMAERTNTDLLPSFVWFRMYFGGDVCRVHSDRSACEMSLSLTLGYSDGIPWDLDIGTRAIVGKKGIADDFGDEPFLSFTTLPGDAVLYKGSCRRHGRVTPNPNRWSAHVFFNWVQRGGPHSDEAFEQLAIGTLPAPA